MSVFWSETVRFVVLQTNPARKNTIKSSSKINHEGNLSSRKKDGFGLSVGAQAEQGAQAGSKSVSFDSLNYAQVGDQYYL